MTSQGLSDTEKLRRRNRELSILNAIAEALNRQVDLSRALQVALAQVARLLDLSTGWIWLLREDTGDSYLAAALNLPPALARHPHRMEGTCYCLDTFRAGDMDGAANVNVVTCSRLKWLDDGTAGLRYHASIPLYAHGRRLGVLNVASPDWRELSVDDLRLLYTVGDLVSIAIERARLFEQRAAHGAAEERNRLAREIHDTLAQGLTAITLQLETADALLEANAAERARQAGNAEQAIAQYRKALQELPAADWRDRYRIAMQLDTLYQARQAYDKRIALYDEFQSSAPEGELRDRLRLYQSQLYREWGDAELARKRPPEALQRYRRGLALLKPGEGPWRVDLLVSLGRVYEQQGKYGDAVKMHERELAALGDAPSQHRLQAELGRLYIAWGQRAEKAKQTRAARTRYGTALQRLPPDDWQERLAATAALAALLERDGKAADAAGLYAALLPHVTDAPTRQRYALYLGRVYKEKLNQPPEARKWLSRAAEGPGHPMRIEAGYLLSDLDVAEGRAQEARARLEALVVEGLDDSQWAVPIHYRLAVLLHEDKKLEQALQHYRIVAEVTSEQWRKLYPRPIAQAQQQADAIASYLRLQGGQADVTVPKVK